MGFIYLLNTLLPWDSNFNYIIDMNNSSIALFGNNCFNSAKIA